MRTVFYPNLCKLSFFAQPCFISQVFASHSGFSLCLLFSLLLLTVFLLTFNGNTKSNIKCATPPQQEIMFSLRLLPLSWPTKSSLRTFRFLNLSASSTTLLTSNNYVMLAHRKIIEIFGSELDLWRYFAIYVKDLWQFLFKTELIQKTRDPQRKIMNFAKHDFNIFTKEIESRKPKNVFTAYSYLYF